jgi:single-strand DNA-binding protein
MASLNKVLVIGNLTRDPDLRTVGSGTTICEFGIAMNRKFRTAGGEDREEVTFVDVSVFGKRGEAAAKYFQKGKPIFIEGRLKYDSWDDKNGGGKRSKVSLIADDWQFVGDGGGKKQEGGDDAPPQRRSQRSAPPKGRKPADANEGDEQQFKDDDIPF